MGLVHLHQILAIDVILSEQLDVLGAVNALQPINDLVFIPVPETRLAQ
jgi:hypothetical protein